MKEYDQDLMGNRLQKDEEINIVYEGPSFEGQMEISDLTSQLKSTEEIIRGIIEEVIKDKKLQISSKDARIYLKLNKGSFQETILIILSHPLTASIIGGCIVALFNRWLRKKEDDKCSININKIVNNYLFVKNANNMIEPLQKEKDSVKISSHSNPEINTEIRMSDKKIMHAIIKEIEEKESIEHFEEEFFGYISMVDLDKDKFSFSLEGNEKHIPVSFDARPNLGDIKDVLGERIKIRAKATYKNGEIIKLVILSYEIKERRSLKDYN